MSKFSLVACDLLTSLSVRLLVVPALRYVSAVLAIVRCLSVSLSVCHKSQFYQKSWTDRCVFLASVLPFTYPTCTVLYGQVSAKWGYFPLEFCPKLWTFYFFKHSLRHVDRRRNVFYTLLVRQRWTLSAINWTVFGRTACNKLTILVTVD